MNGIGSGGVEEEEKMWEWWTSSVVASEGRPPLGPIGDGGGSVRRTIDKPHLLLTYLVIILSY